MIVIKNKGVMKLFQEEAEAVSVRPQFYVLFLFSTAATVSG